jgi:hypothetical protein
MKNSKDHPEKPNEKLGLRKVQRVYPIAPTFDETDALLTDGLHSANEIVSEARQDAEPNAGAAEIGPS